MSEEHEGPEPYTYVKAGVSIAAGNALVKAIAPLARATARPGADAALGGFGGFFDLKAAGYRDPLLVAANDGVGTKVKLAIDSGRHAGIGIDLVAMCANDLIVQGAEPLFFLDYFACGRLDPNVAEAVIASIAEGCRQAGCALIGGETAEMPGMYAEGDYDLAGFCVGAVERGEALTGADLAPGDVILGLASSGVHSNGYSLVRRLAADKAWKLDRPALFDQDQLLIEALLAPTRIYVRPLLPEVRAGRIKALAHITGGGLLENIPRVLPDGAHATVDADAWPQSRLMAFLQAQGNIEPAEMARTFNCGIGMAVIVAEEDADAASEALRVAGETVHRIGRIDAGERAARFVAARARGRGGATGRPRMPGDKVRTAILLSGRGSNMAAIAEHRRKADVLYEIALIASNMPAARGLVLARRYGFPQWSHSHEGMKREEFDRLLDEALREHGIELVVLAGYMRLLSPWFIDRWRGRILNIHPSLLPHHRGLDTHRRALLAGDLEHGCSVHVVTEALDDGPIIAQARIRVRPRDTAETLAARVLEEEHKLYPVAIDAYCRELRGLPPLA